MALSTSDRLPSPAPDETTSVPSGIAENLTLAEATELLDWLEGHGIRAEEVRLTDDGKMTIRWGV
jgi:hypothetical protein